MPEYVVQLVQDGLNHRKKSLKEARILILGAAYKKDISDLRESPAIKIMEILLKKGAQVKYNDPYILEITVAGITLSSTKLNEQLYKTSDCVLIATDHSAYNYKSIVKGSSLTVDTRNATAAVNREDQVKIIRI